MQVAELDVEHLLVEDDPRLWSKARKNGILAVIAYAAMGGTITANIFLPAIKLVQRDLATTDNLIAATVSIFIVFQGWTPLLWSAFSEILGRKRCYLASITLYLAGTVACSQANSIGLFIGMRILRESPPPLSRVAVCFLASYGTGVADGGRRAAEAIGSSAVLALGAGTLSDIYDAHERGTKLGIYYAVPLLGKPHNTSLADRVFGGHPQLPKLIEPLPPPSPQARRSARFSAGPCPSRRPGGARRSTS